jgi:hypothetical protein
VFVIPVLLLVVAATALASGGAPGGTYKGTARPDKGFGSAHAVSFAVRGGRMSKLVIGPGQMYCHIPDESGQPGSLPGFFNAPSPRLSGFPAVKLLKFAGQYELNVSYERAGSTWRVFRGTMLSNGPGYAILTGAFDGSRFNGTVQLQYGADAKGKPTFAPGPEECNFEGSLRARKG